jgi:HK97 family phage major capsid protein
VTEERKALAKMVRMGDAGEFKTYSVGDDPSGGYLVAPVLSASINRRVFDVSPLGRLARRISIPEGDAFEEPIDDGDIGATWVGENDARPATATSDLKYLLVSVKEIYALQTVTQRLLDDSRFDVGAWVEGKIADKFARTEGTAFITGDGVGKPRGLLSYPSTTDVDGVRPWFTIQHVNTGANGAFIAATTTASPADCLVDLVYALRAPYRPNARFLMNRRTAGAVRKLKDSEGKFIWADAREGQPATLLGFPVELDEQMPDIATGSMSIAFGDMAQAYMVVEKPGVRLLRDPFTSKPNVLMYAYRRVGGGLQNGEAVKLLRFAA